MTVTLLHDIIYLLMGEEGGDIMNDKITQMAHDFALAAVNCYQSAENSQAAYQNRKPQYELDELIKTYLEALDRMEEELDERDYQRSSSSK